MGKLSGRISSYLLSLAVISSGIAFSSGLSRVAQDSREWHAQVVPKLTAARKISAGEDRIWSTQEKRRFLDDFGFEDAILQEGQDIYFRRKEGTILGMSTEFGTNAEIVLGNNLENNGGFLRGSSANSGTYVGVINEEDLISYLER